MKYSPRLLLSSLAILSCLTFPGYSAESKDAAAPGDQTENSYYWQGTQLYNLGRLNEAFESFEKAIQRKQNAKESEAYLLQIRQEIVTNAKRLNEAKSALNYGNMDSPESALHISYPQKGHMKVTLHAKFLFNENTALLKAGSVDVLNRLANVLDAKEGNYIELTMLDELDSTAAAKNIDAERTLVVFAYLNLKKIGTPSG